MKITKATIQNLRGLLGGDWDYVDVIIEQLENVGLVRVNLSRGVNGKFFIETTSYGQQLVKQYDNCIVYRVKVNLGLVKV